ncbi:MAG: DNA mismatch repair endonuclease MutL [Lentisphaeria bacterium]|nr:DNA mismatch repair endonuclease MutL [Lentisphaeria bacterium]
MSKIKVMSTALSNRIAAGEVIERPASVVKELVENAIDAGSSFITVEVERAGSRLIAVTDDGCGMDQEDAALSLEQHGTSKLLSEDDLEHIMTLGFRGEALPSIASVSRFTMITRTADAPEGTKITTSGGVDIDIAPTGAPVGTRIEVRDLFFNLPARKKFLKSAATEEHHIEEMMIMLAIGHPQTGFRLQLDGRVAFHTPPCSQQQQRLRELFGKSFVDKMLFFEHVENGLHLSGCIAAPGFTRPSRRDQRIFINSRPVEAQAVYRGIKEGYATLAEPGRYNPVVIFIDMPPDDLDVNVHPAKREVRFKSEFVISRAVASAVSAALRRNRETPGIQPDASNLPASGKLPLSLVLDAAEIRYAVATCEQRSLNGLEPPLPVEKTVSVCTATHYRPPMPEDWQDHTRPATRPEPPPVPEKETVFTEPDTVEIPCPAPQVDTKPEPPAEPEVEFIPPSTPPVPEQPENTMPSAVPSMRGSAGKMWDAPASFSGNWPSRIIGVFDNTYILAESASGLVLIDQHAAHERVMFERLLDEAEKNPVVQQPLLLPEVVELPRQEASMLLKYRDDFERLGFDIESAGGATIMLNSIPQSFGKCRDIAGFFADMLAELNESSELKSSVRPEHIARAACRAAVKAHDVLSGSALNQLLEDLKQCRQGTLCPHGRPTMFTLSNSEIEKRFQRR